MEPISSRHKSIVAMLFLVLLFVVPAFLLFVGKPFWLDVFTRLLILAIAAASLNLLLGVAGLASFGHAAYLGLGAYAVGVAGYHETYGGAQWIASYNGFWHLFLAIGVCSLFALITGAISLRTKGVHFIMITMAFSQMVFYMLLSLEEYGGDDGLSIDLRSEFSFIDLEDPWVFFCVCYALMLFVLFILSRLKQSHFGRVLQAAAQNEERVNSLGINPYFYRLLAFVIAGAICGLAGALHANYSYFIAPSVVEWMRSGELMFMVILGGVTSLFGPVVGAAVFVLLEFALSRLTLFWHLPFGLILLCVVLFGRGGIVGSFGRQRSS